MKRPTHWLKVMNKSTNHKTIAGAGWQNPDGSISISLNPFIVMTPDPDMVITLFPADFTMPKKEETIS